MKSLFIQTQDGKIKIETKLQVHSMRKIGNSDFSTKTTNYTRNSNSKKLSE